jgi:hypothetical protein
MPYFSTLLPDDLVPAPAQVPDEVVDVFAEVRRICLRMASSPERLPVTWPPLRPVAPQPILWLSTMATSGRARPVRRRWRRR